MATSRKVLEARARNLAGIDPPEQPDVEWRPVVGYEGYYAVNNLGAIWRIKGVRGRAPGLCKLYGDSGYGYLRVSLSRDGLDRVKRVHRVVAEAFLGSCPPGMEVCHGPGGRFDNRVANLRYDTHSANMVDSYQWRG